MIIFLQVIGGLALLFFGGETLIRGAITLARNLGLSTFVIGLTVVAYGTSSPELVISTQAALTGHVDIAFGNVVGSNISNILCVLGLTAILCPVLFNKQESFPDMMVVLAASLLLYAVSFLGTLHFIIGLTFLTLLCIYTVYIFRKSQQTPDTHSSEDMPNKLSLNTWQALLVCALGFGILLIGADILIEGASSLAKYLGISEAIIGVTIVAFGGSVPELATSVIAAYHKRVDIALGNIIGSNLFNILGIIGISSLVAPIEINSKFLSFDLPIMFLGTLLLFALLLLRAQLSRCTGAVFFN